MLLSHKTDPFVLRCPLYCIHAYDANRRQQRLVTHDDKPNAWDDLVDEVGGWCSVSPSFGLPEVSNTTTAVRENLSPLSISAETVGESKDDRFATISDAGSAYYPVVLDGSWNTSGTSARGSTGRRVSFGPNDDDGQDDGSDEDARMVSALLDFRLQLKKEAEAEVRAERNTTPAGE